MHYHLRITLHVDIVNSLRGSIVAIFQQKKSWAGQNAILETLYVQYLCWQD